MSTPLASMALSELLPELQLPADSADLEVRGLTADSRAVEPGDVYVALVGAVHDGHDYIDDAFAKGAIAIVLDPALRTPAEWSHLPVPVLALPALRDRLPQLAAHFYRNPGEKIRLIGVTGTNGKTTCSWLLAAALAKLASRAGLVGTLGWGEFTAREVELQHTGLTTPGVLQLQRCLASLVQRGCEHVAMEVSSHALSQDRVGSLHFDTAIFTNLSRDHLDFHGDMQSYAAAKRMLFDWPGLQHAILNVDDATGREWAAGLPASLHTLTYSLQDTQADIHVCDVRYAMHGIEAEVVTPKGKADLQLALIGKFNLANSLAVLAALLAAGFSLAKIIAALASVAPVPGRMQIVELQAGPGPRTDESITVVVDYAHTPDALALALQALRPHAQAALRVVFGAGGDRDSGKRPLMGAVAEEHADSVILTSDNPRGERPAAIIADIRAGMRAPQAAHIEPDRGAAIAHAIESADSGDIVLIAGKGHEAEQIIGDERIAFSDCDVARRELQRRFAA